MFKLGERYELDRKILKYGYIRYSPAEMSTISLPISQIYITIPREDFVFSLNSYLELIFEVIKKTDKSSYANGDGTRMVNLGPTASFSNFLLKTSSGKHLEDISHVHIVFSMYKLLKSSRCSDDLSIGFDRDHNRGPDELTRNKNIKK